MTIEVCQTQSFNYVKLFREMWDGSGGVSSHGIRCQKINPNGQFWASNVSFFFKISPYFSSIDSSLNRTPCPLLSALRGEGGG